MHHLAAGQFIGFLLDIRCWLVSVDYCCYNRGSSMQQEHAVVLCVKEAKKLDFHYTCVIYKNFRSSSIQEHLQPVSTPLNCCLNDILGI